MNKKLILSVLLVIFLLTVVSVVVFAQSSPNVRWEYKAVRWQGENYNELGLEGWELVSTNLNSNGYTTMFFKRRLP